MRPVASTMTEIDHMEGDEVKFSISPANSAWVMRSMADLYSNRELACIREYSTNAYDSNKEKAIRDGHEIKPIQVTLPSAMNPYFTVQDFGVGMSETELREIYTQFGESTKRDSDDFNGMLGFGSKSAIAYTNTFTVEAVKKGVKTVGVITRREDAMGGYLVTMKIVISDMLTAEPDGVKVQIPVHNWREFEQKAQDFYRFWKPGRVLVNGVPPKWAVGEKIDDDLYYYPNAGASYVVMGNVPYKIANPDALFPAGMNKISFVAYVPVGAVEFTPAREALKYSDHTKNNLHKIINDFVGKAVSTAKTEIAAATTHAEAYKQWSKWRKIIGRGQVDDLTFKGEKVVDRFTVVGKRYTCAAYRGGTWSIRDYGIDEVANTLFVTEFSPELAAAHKRKVKDWLKHVGMQAAYVVFTPDKINCVWVDPDRIVTWQRVKDEAPKPPRKPRVVNQAWGRKAGSFDLIGQQGVEREQDVPDIKPLYYISVQEYNASKNLAEVLRSFDIDTKVVLLPANRAAKFLRHYGHAQPILAELKARVNLDGPSMISDDGKKYLKMNWTERAMLGKMDMAKIDDPEVVSLIALVNKGEDHFLKEYKRQYRLAHVLGMGNKFVRHQWEMSYNCKWRPVTDKYPLSTAFESYNVSNEVKEHVYVYMSAVYAARKDGKNV